ncbi:MAG: insulinase family protein [Gammaproteobacteria bacterium]
MAKIAHEDIVSFYRRFYHPANAVLAIAGDVDTHEALASAQILRSNPPGIATRCPVPQNLSKTASGASGVNFLQRAEGEQAMQG